MENNDIIQGLQSQIISWIFSMPDEDLVLLYVEKLPSKYEFTISEITSSSLLRLNLETDTFFHSINFDSFTQLKRSEQFYYFNFITAYGFEDGFAQLKSITGIEFEKSEHKLIEEFANRYIGVWDAIVALSVSSNYLNYLLYISSVASLATAQDVAEKYEQNLEFVTLHLSKNLESGQIPKSEEIDEERLICSKLPFLSPIALDDLLRIENMQKRYDLYMSLADIFAVILRTQLSFEVPNIATIKVKIWALLKQREQRVILAGQDIEFYMNHSALRGLSQWYDYFNRLWVPEKFMKEGFISDFKMTVGNSGIQDKNNLAELLTNFLQSSVVISSLLDPYDSYAIVNRIVVAAKEGMFENLRDTISLYPESIKDIINHIFSSIFETLRYLYQK